jgi:hypothetical protein
VAHPQLFVVGTTTYINKVDLPRGEFGEKAISAAGPSPFGFGGTDEGFRPYTRRSFICRTRYLILFLGEDEVGEDRVWGVGRSVRRHRIVVARF